MLWTTVLQHHWGSNSYFWRILITRYCSTSIICKLPMIWPTFLQPPWVIHSCFWKICTARMCHWVLCWPHLHRKAELKPRRVLWSGSLKFQRTPTYPTTAIYWLSVLFPTVLLLDQESCSEYLRTLITRFSLPSDLRSQVYNWLAGF